MTVGMSFWSWKALRVLSAFVDSADDGSHDEAALFWTSVSFWANPAAPTRTRTQRPRTIHLVTGLVSLPAICLCMAPLHQKTTTLGIGDYPETARVVAGSRPDRHPPYA